MSETPSFYFVVRVGGCEAVGRRDSGDSIERVVAVDRIARWTEDLGLVACCVSHEIASHPVYIHSIIGAV